MLFLWCIEIKIWYILVPIVCKRRCSEKVSLIKIVWRISTDVSFFSERQEDYIILCPTHLKRFRMYWAGKGVVNAWTFALLSGECPYVSFFRQRFVYRARNSRRIHMESSTFVGLYAVKCKIRYLASACLRSLGSDISNQRKRYLALLTSPSIKHIEILHTILL